SLHFGCRHRCPLVFQAIKTSNELKTLNARVRSFMDRIQNLSETLRHAKQSNIQLREVIEEHMSTWKRLTTPVEELASALPSVDAIVNDPEASQTLSETQRLFGKVDEMCRQRAELVDRLRQALHEDDVTGDLLTLDTDQCSVESWFSKRLKKHDPLVGLIRQNLAAQENIESALIDINASFAPQGTQLREIRTRRAEELQKLISSGKTFEDLLERCNRGLDFYEQSSSRLKETIAELKELTEKLNNEEQKLLNLGSPPGAVMVRHAYPPLPSSKEGFAPPAQFAHIPTLGDYMKSWRARPTDMSMVRPPSSEAWPAAPVAGMINPMPPVASFPSQPLTSQTPPISGATALARPSPFGTPLQQYGTRPFGQMQPQSVRPPNILAQSAPIPFMRPSSSAPVTPATQPVSGLQPPPCSQNRSMQPVSPMPMPVVPPAHHPPLMRPLSQLNQPVMFPAHRMGAELDAQRREERLRATYGSQPSVDSTAVNSPASAGNPRDAGSVTASSVPTIATNPVISASSNSTTMLHPNPVSTAEPNRDVGRTVDVSAKSVEPEPLSDPLVLNRFIAATENLLTWLENLNEPIQGATVHSSNKPAPTKLDAAWTRVLNLATDYQGAPLFKGKKPTQAAALCCSSKNRRQDFVPFDANRVVLDSSKNDYINASHIDFLGAMGEWCPRYIIAQAPMQKTIVDFWNMIISQGCEVVVLLLPYRHSRPGSPLSSFSNANPGEGGYGDPSDPHHIPTHLPVNKVGARFSIPGSSLEIRLQAIKESTQNDGSGGLRTNGSMQSDSGKSDSWTERILTVHNVETQQTRSLVHLCYHGSILQTGSNTSMDHGAEHLCAFINHVHTYYKQQRSLLKTDRSSVGLLHAERLGRVADVVDIAGYLCQQRRGALNNPSQLVVAARVIAHAAVETVARRDVVVGPRRYSSSVSAHNVPSSKAGTVMLPVSEASPSANLIDTLFSGRTLQLNELMSVVDKWTVSGNSLASEHSPSNHGDSVKNSLMQQEDPPVRPSSMATPSLSAGPNASNFGAQTRQSPSAQITSPGPTESSHCNFGQQIGPISSSLSPQQSYHTGTQMSQPSIFSACSSRPQSTFGSTAVIPQSASYPAHPFTPRPPVTFSSQSPYANFHPSKQPLEPSGHISVPPPVGQPRQHQQLISTHPGPFANYQPTQVRHPMPAATTHHMSNPISAGLAGPMPVPQQYGQPSQQRHSSVASNVDWRPPNIVCNTQPQIGSFTGCQRFQPLPSTGSAIQPVLATNPTQPPQPAMHESSNQVHVLETNSNHVQQPLSATAPVVTDFVLLQPHVLTKAELDAQRREERLRATYGSQPSVDSTAVNSPASAGNPRDAGSVTASSVPTIATNPVISASSNSTTMLHPNPVSTAEPNRDVGRTVDVSAKSVEPEPLHGKSFNLARKLERTDSGSHRSLIKNKPAPTKLDAAWTRVLNLATDYQGAPLFKGKKPTQAAALCCSSKNRRQDFVPFDANRVVLDSSKNDYINASHIDFLGAMGEWCPRYIIAQAPMQKTIVDFWNMIISQGCEVVVLLLPYRHSRPGSPLSSFSNANPGEGGYGDPSDPHHIPTHLPVNKVGARFSIPGSSLEIRLQAIKESTQNDGSGGLRTNGSMQSDSGKSDSWTERILTVHNVETQQTRSLVHLCYHGSILQTGSNTSMDHGAEHLCAFINHVHTYYKQQRSLLKTDRSSVGLLHAERLGRVADVVDIAGYLCQQRRGALNNPSQLVVAARVIAHAAVETVARRDVVVGPRRYSSSVSAHNVPSSKAGTVMLPVSEASPSANLIDTLFSGRTLQLNELMSVVDKWTVSGNSLASEHSPSNHGDSVKNSLMQQEIAEDDTAVRHPCEPNLDGLLVPDLDSSDVRSSETPGDGIGQQQQKQVPPIDHLVELSSLTAADSSPRVKRYTRHEFQSVVATRSPVSTTEDLFAQLDPLVVSK
ncbi:hypothetical protein AHF37_07720, partial [Paragonimus kellicotti]